LIKNQAANAQRRSKNSSPGFDRCAFFSTASSRRNKICHFQSMGQLGLADLVTLTT
jgi:hypothetical protein